MLRRWHGDVRCSPCPSGFADRELQLHSAMVRAVCANDRLNAGSGLLTGASLGDVSAQQLQARVAQQGGAMMQKAREIEALGSRLGASQSLHLKTSLPYTAGQVLHDNATKDTSASRTTNRFHLKTSLPDSSGQVSRGAVTQ